MRSKSLFGSGLAGLGEDGDPLDVFVLMDAPVVPGCVIRARPIGAIEAKQKAKGEDWQRNDRLIAVATHAQTHETVKSLEDLRPHLFDEIKAFFIDYNRLRGRKFKPLALSGPSESRRLIKSGMEAFEQESRGSTESACQPRGMWQD